MQVHDLQYGIFQDIHTHREQVNYESTKNLVNGSTSRAILHQTKYLSTKTEICLKCVKFRENTLKKVEEMWIEQCQTVI